MKHIFKLTILFSVTLILNSCEFYKRPPLGDCWDPPYLSTRTLSFDASGGIGTITFNPIWAIDDMYINNWEFENMLACGDGSEINETGEGICQLVYHVSIHYDSISKHPGSPIIRRWEATWFSITMEKDEKSNNQLIFVVKPNDTGKSRTLLMGMSIGNCFTSLAIGQSAE